MSIGPALDLVWREWRILGVRVELTKEYSCFRSQLRVMLQELVL
jgi:hypothetical protein